MKVSLRLFTPVLVLSMTVSLSFSLSLFFPSNVEIHNGHSFCLFAPHVEDQRACIPSKHDSPNPSMLILNRPVILGCLSPQDDATVIADCTSEDSAAARQVHADY